LLHEEHPVDNFFAALPPSFIQMAGVFLIGGARAEDLELIRCETQEDMRVRVSDEADGGWPIYIGTTVDVAARRAAHKYRGKMAYAWTENMRYAEDRHFDLFKGWRRSNVLQASGRSEGDPGYIYIIYVPRPGM
jgi:hypothetical protein